MPEEIGTRDVLEQFDTRLGNVEQDMRQFRTEVNGRFDRLEGKLDTTARWLVGLILLSWLSLMASIWLKS